MSTLTAKFLTGLLCTPWLPARPPASSYLVCKHYGWWGRCGGEQRDDCRPPPRHAPAGHLSWMEALIVGWTNYKACSKNQSQPPAARLHVHGSRADSARRALACASVRRRAHGTCNHNNIAPRARVLFRALRPY